MDDPFIRNYVEDLLKKIRTQVGWHPRGKDSKGQARVHVLVRY